MSDEEFDFEEQIRLEKEEKLKAAKRRVDEDGTEYEWDEAKQAWFPKVNRQVALSKARFIIS